MSADRIAVDPTEHPGREWIGHGTVTDYTPFSSTAEIPSETTAEPLEPESPATFLPSTNDDIIYDNG